MLNEGTYIIGDVFVGIAGDEDYREFRVYEQRTSDEIRTG